MQRNANEKEAAPIYKFWLLFSLRRQNFISLQIVLSIRSNENRTVQKGSRALKITEEKKHDYVTTLISHNPTILITSD